MCGGVSVCPVFGATGRKTRQRQVVERKRVVRAICTNKIETLIFFLPVLDNKRFRWLWDLLALQSSAKIPVGR